VLNPTEGIEIENQFQNKIRQTNIPIDFENQFQNWIKK
jgi:hypothetical protein